jgi:dihydroorotate dehydrogenase
MAGEITTPFIISPPFGNYIKNHYESCTPVIGSLTLEKRPHWFLRALKTVRPVEGGWINNIGLRNPGIKSFKYNYTNDVLYNQIYSLVGIKGSDWQAMLTYLPDEDKRLKIELNLSCPNVHEYGITKKDLQEYCDRFSIIVKVPPIADKAFAMAEMAVTCGARYIHASNTLPSDRGGVSGEQLFKVNLPIVKKLHLEFPDTPIIAGGGNYDLIHLLDYLTVGATKLSFSSVWFNPFRAHRLITHATKYGYTTTDPAPLYSSQKVEIR